MKSIPWILLAIGAGIVAAYVLVNQPRPQYATGNDDVEDAADRTALWGSKQRLDGKGGRVPGKVKEAIGRATGNDELTDKGVTDQVAGSVKDAAGNVAQA
jgi:uncharacterized protein YjbJ (UPF0337 family)